MRRLFFIYLSKMPESPWVPQRQAADYLGMSERTLMRYRQAGVLQPGEHYRRKFMNSRSALLYNLPATDAAITAQFARDHRTLEQAVG